MPSFLRIRPSDPRAQAFRAVVAVLQRSPPLRNLGAVWQTYDGTPTPKAGQDTDRPWIELEPSLGPTQPLALTGFLGQVTVETPVLVKVRTRTQGSLADNSINLWGLVEAALFPADPMARGKVWQELRANGVNDLEVVQPAATAEDNDTTEGVIKITTYVTN